MILSIRTVSWLVLLVSDAGALQLGLRNDPG